MSNFTIRQSSIKSFFTCPAQYKYSLEWLPNDDIIPDFFKYGIEAHAIMEGVKGNYLPKSIEYAAILKKKLDSLLTIGLEINGREMQQYVHIMRGVTLSRRIDVLAYWPERDQHIIIDYKTSSNPWQQVSANVYPEAMGMQSAAYTIPPKRGTKWADIMCYLVTSIKEPIWYEHDDDDVEYLKSAIRIIQSAKEFPKIRGYACHHCTFKQLCYGVKQWEKNYTHR